MNVEDINVGDYIRVYWTTNRPKNFARILAVREYTGMYPQFYTCILTVENPKTPRGYTEIAYDSRSVFHPSTEYLTQSEFLERFPESTTTIDR